jgi:hypothetical protein
MSLEIYRTVHTHSIYLVTNKNAMAMDHDIVRIYMVAIHLVIYDSTVQYSWANAPILCILCLSAYIDLLKNEYCGIYHDIV